MTPLARVLADRIRRDGPITVAAYMAAALGDPDHGYYTTHDPFGAAGDFTTAPEISQMFGELLGLWTVAHWQAMGEPRHVRLIELGPGRGTLMADALRAARAVPAFMAAVHVDLVEISPTLRDRQSETLNGAVPAGRLAWHETLQAVPPGPTILLANEFFDALPIHQCVRTTDGWRERRIDTAEDGRLRFIAAESVDPPDVPGAASAEAGAIAESCPAARVITETLSGRLSQHGGAALIVDYGHTRSALGDTLQALRRHAFCDVLATPGEADVTAHVDFDALGSAARGAGAEVFGPLDQSALLLRLGLRERTAALRSIATPEQAADVDTAFDRLTGRSAMGRLFKAVAVGAPGGPVPPGFES